MYAGYLTVWVASNSNSKLQTTFFHPWKITPWNPLKWRSGGLGILMWKAVHFPQGRYANSVMWDFLSSWIPRNIGHVKQPQFPSVSQKKCESCPQARLSFPCFPPSSRARFPKAVMLRNSAKPRNSTGPIYLPCITRNPTYPPPPRNIKTHYWLWYTNFCLCCFWFLVKSWWSSPPSNKWTDLFVCRW